MRTLARNKRTLYLCQKYKDGNLIKYKKPIKLKENYLPTNSEGDLISIGMDYPMYLRIKTSIKEKDLFHPKDRLYVYKDKPKQHDVLCKKADYEVYKKPMLYINEMEVMLHRLSSDEDE